MSGRPVLQSSFEYHVWKSLDGKAFSKGGPLALVREIEEYSGKINSSVLVMMIDALQESNLIDKTTLKTIVSKSRATDCLPSIRACEVLLDLNDPDGAEELLSMSAGSQEMVQRPLAEARVRLKRGDRDGAASSAGTAYGYDSRCRGAYKVLAETDPEGGWPQRENIQDIIEGGKPSNPPGTGRVQELYTIYYDWYVGRRDAATGKLISSVCYREKDPEYLLASARMSVMEKDWHSASMVYSELISMDAPPFVYVEAAEAAIGGGDFTRALDLLSKADRNQTRVIKDTIKARMLAGDRVEMLDAIRSLLDNERCGSDEYVTAVRFLIGRGLDREAAALLDKYSRFVGDDPDTLTMRSIMMMRSGDYPSAKRAVSKAVRMDKMNASARAQLARVLYLMNRTEAAERECSSILAQDHDNADALALLRDLHMSTGDYERAAGICRRILESTPGDIPAMMALAISTGETGDRQAASDMFHAVLKEDGSRERAVAVVSSMLSCGLDRDALSLCSSLERQFPKEPMLKRLKGNAEYRQGDYLKASVSYADAAALDPHNPVLWHSKGMADEARGDYESAEDAYNRALLLDQGEAEYWISKATVQEMTKDRFGAIESLNRAIELDPHSVFALIRKAAILRSASRYREALFYVRQASEVTPDDVRILDMEADLLASLGDIDSAVSVMERRISIETAEAPSIRLARLLLSKGERDRAIVSLDRAIELVENPTRLKEERESIVSGNIGPRAEPRSEPEPEPVFEQEVRREDPVALLSMSESLMEAGDLKGAMRMIDRALIADPDNPELYCHKARVALARGDVDGAAFLTGNALRTNPSHPGLHEVSALAREAKGDTRGALTEVDLAISNGLDTAAIQALKGRLLLALGKPEMAVTSFSAAVSKDPGNGDILESLASAQMTAGDVPGAYSTVSRLLRKEPARLSAIMMKADMCARRGDGAGLVSCCDLMASCQGVPEETKIRLVRILEEAGLRDEARMLVEGRAESHEYDVSVKRYAEKALRRAFTTRTSAGDPDILDALGLDPDVAREVSAYIAEIPDAGRISPDMDDFEAMERQSHDVIVKMKWTDLEGSPTLPLEKVFVSGGFRDADSAKALVAYVQKAMLMPLPADVGERISGLAMGLPKGLSVFEIMRQCDVGVYEARAAKDAVV